jgi:hypothetical protein
MEGEGVCCEHVNAGPDLGWDLTMRVMMGTVLVLPPTGISQSAIKVLPIMNRPLGQGGFQRSEEALHPAVLPGAVGDDVLRA